MMGKKLRMLMGAACIILLCAAVSCQYGTARRNAGKRYADSLPVLNDSVFGKPVVCIVDSVYGISRFRYENGRMTGGDCGRFGSFTVHSCPLAIEVGRRPGVAGKSLPYDARYENICIDDSGRAVSMELIATNFSADDSVTKGRKCRIRYSMSYQDGYLSELSFSLKSGYGKEQTGTVSYMWERGILVARVCEFHGRRYRYEEHISQTFLYSDRDSLPSVAGIYLYDQRSSPYIHDFVWYTGLLGKPMKKLPERVRIEWCGDCGNRLIEARLGGADGTKARKVVFEDGEAVGYSYEAYP